MISLANKGPFDAFKEAIKEALDVFKGEKDLAEAADDLIDKLEE